MPSFLPPAAASSEVLRTLNEQNEAQRNLEALTADVDIALEEIKGTRAAAEVQLQNVHDVQGERMLLDEQLAAFQQFAEAFLEAAKGKEAAIKAHISTVHAEEEALKARQKDVRDGEAAVTAAHEARDKAEAKVAAAKVEHEKALKRAKAAGIVPDLPATSPPEVEKGAKPSERRKSRENERERRRTRSRSRSLDRRKSARSRSRERERQRSRSRDRRPIRETHRSRRVSPPSWRDRDRGRDRYRDRDRDRGRERRPSPRRRSRSRHRRSRSADRRRASPPRSKRARSRSNDSGRGHKRGRDTMVATSGKVDKDGKADTSGRSKDTEASGDRKDAKTNRPNINKMEDGKPSKTPLVNQPDPDSKERMVANGTAAERLDAKDGVTETKPDLRGEDDTDLPLPPPPKRPDSIEELPSAGKDAIASNPNENGEKKVDKPKKEKKDKEAKKHKKEKKEKKESKKSKSSKGKESEDKLVSPPQDQPVTVDHDGSQNS